MRSAGNSRRRVPWRLPGRGSRSFLLPSARLEHLQHALRYDVPADGVARRQKYADETDDTAGGRLRRTERHPCADQHDAVHEVRARHERRVQNDRHARDDLVAGEGREHEDIESDYSVDHVPPSALRVGSCFTSPVCVTQDCAKTSAFQSILSAPLSMAGFRRLKMLRAYISLA